MRTDSFTRRAPIALFIYFAGAIVVGAITAHPAFLAAGVTAGAIYYLMLRGRRGLKTLACVAALFAVISAVNPLFNRAGDTVLFFAFGRPYTLEALIRGALSAGAFAHAVIWFGCFNRVMTEDKFTSLFSRAAPSLSTVLVLTLRLVPETFRRAREIGEAREGIGKGGGAGLREKLSQGVASLGALTSYSLEGGVATGDSMRARGCGTARRTDYNGRRICASDVLFLALTAALIGCVAVFFARGAASTVYEPRFIASALRGESAVCFAAYTAYYLIPAVLHIKEEATWTASKYRI